jgi:uncharacterized membrane protein YbhN (UPF0104 family)
MVRQHTILWYNYLVMQGAAGSPEVEPSSTAERDAHRLRNGLIWTVALLGLLLAIGLAVPDLRGVLDRVASAEPVWVALAIGLEIASCVGYVVFVRLVLWRGPAREVRRLAWAEMAFGAVVPVGGAGGLAVGAWALRAWGVSWSVIANRSAIIFLLTSAVNAGVLALGALGLLIGLGATGLSAWLAIVPAVVAIGMLALFILLPRWINSPAGQARSGKLAGALRSVASWVNATEAVAFRPNWRLLGAIGYLLFDIAVLWSCLRAFDAHPAVLAVVVGYQVGYLSNLLPIPGGVGVLEGGLLGALLLYGLPAAPTAAAVILYHAIALWVPTLGGTIGFARLRGAVAERASQLDIVQDSDVTPQSSAPATARATSIAA